MEVCQKILFQIELIKTDRDLDYGMSVEAELAEDTEQEDELCVFISELTKHGLSHRKGNASHVTCEISTLVPFTKYILEK